MECCRTGCKNDALAESSYCVGHKPSAASAGYLSVGDVVVPIRHENALRSGCCAYDYAIVISVEPFILASAEGDMRWATTAKAENFRRIATADPTILKTAMRRIDR